MTALKQRDVRIATFFTRTERGGGLQKLKRRGPFDPRRLRYPSEIVAAVCDRCAISAKEMYAALVESPLQTDYTS